MPSTNEFAAFYRINPATAAKGMFIVVGARERLIKLRRRQVADGVGGLHSRSAAVGAAFAPNAPQLTGTPQIVVDGLRRRSAAGRIPETTSPSGCRSHSDRFW